MGGTHRYIYRFFFSFFFFYECAKSGIWIVSERCPLFERSVLVAWLFTRQRFERNCFVLDANLVFYKIQNFVVLVIFVAPFVVNYFRVALSRVVGGFRVWNLACYYYYYYCFGKPGRSTICGLPCETDNPTRGKM